MSGDQFPLFLHRFSSRSFWYYFIALSPKPFVQTTLRMMALVKSKSRNRWMKKKNEIKGLDPPDRWGEKEAPFGRNRGLENCREKKLTINGRIQFEILNHARSFFVFLSYIYDIYSFQISTSHAMFRRSDHRPWFFTPFSREKRPQGTERRSRNAKTAR